MIAPAASARLPPRIARRLLFARIIVTPFLLNRLLHGRTQ
jgi:hypothetical protein